MSQDIAIFLSLSGANAETVRTNRSRQCPFKSQYVIFIWLYSPLLDLGRFPSFLYFTQSVGFFGRGISPSQGLYLHTVQHKRRINAHNTDIHALSGIRTHDPSIRASEDSSCLRPRGHCDRLKSQSIFN
jgi:hypothetical protein